MKTQIFSLILFFSFLWMNAETQTRYYNGIITKDQVVVELEKYFEFIKSRNIQFKKSDIKSKYDFKVAYDDPVDSDNSVLSSVIYKIDDDKLTITIEKCALFRGKQRDVFMLGKNADQEALRTIYQGTSTKFFDALFTFLNIEKKYDAFKTCFFLW